MYFPGRFQLFSSAKNDKPNSPSKQMVYRMVLNSVENTTFSFHGVKRIHKNHFWQIGLRDTTLLFVKIYKGSHFYGNVLGTAKLYITVPNFATQLESLEVTNAESVRERMYWIARFGTFFSKTLWDVYGPGVRAHSSNFDDEDDEVPRQRRAMKVGICIPFVYELETKDGVSIGSGTSKSRLGFLGGGGGGGCEVKSIVEILRFNTQPTAEYYVNFSL